MPGRNIPQLVPQMRRDFGFSARTECGSSKLHEMFPRAMCRLKTKNLCGSPAKWPPARMLSADFQNLFRLISVDWNAVWRSESGRSGSLAGTAFSSVHLHGPWAGALCFQSGRLRVCFAIETFPDAVHRLSRLFRQLSRDTICSCPACHPLMASAQMVSFSRAVRTSSGRSNCRSPCGRWSPGSGGSPPPRSRSHTG